MKSHDSKARMLLALAAVAIMMVVPAAVMVSDSSDAYAVTTGEKGAYFKTSENLTYEDFSKLYDSYGQSSLINSVKSAIWISGSYAESGISFSDVSIEASTGLKVNSDSMESRKSTVMSASFSFTLTSASSMTIFSLPMDGVADLYKAMNDNKISAGDTLKISGRFSMKSSEQNNTSFTENASHSFVVTREESKQYAIVEVNDVNIILTHGGDTCNCSISGKSYAKMGTSESYDFNGINASDATSSSIVYKTTSASGDVKYYDYRYNCVKGEHKLPSVEVDYGGIIRLMGGSPVTVGAPKILNEDIDTSSVTYSSIFDHNTYGGEAALNNALIGYGSLKSDYGSASGQSDAIFREGTVNSFLHGANLIFYIIIAVLVLLILIMFILLIRKKKKK